MGHKSSLLKRSYASVHINSRNEDIVIKVRFTQTKLHNTNPLNTKCYKSSQDG